jgi:hypothetical protein
VGGNQSTGTVSRMVVDETKKLFVVQMCIKEYINPSLLCKWFNI